MHLIENEYVRGSMVNPFHAPPLISVSVAREDARLPCPLSRRCRDAVEISPRLFCKSIDDPLVDLTNVLWDSTLVINFPAENAENLERQRNSKFLNKVTLIQLLS